MGFLKYKREYIKQLKQLVDPVSLLLQVGQISPKHIREIQDDIRCPCPIHGGNNPTGFSWKKTTGNWCCYTRGCGGDTISHDVYGFLQLKLGLPFEDAVEYLEKFLNISATEKQLMIQKSEVRSTENDLKKLKFNKDDSKKVEILDYLPYFDREYFSLMVEYLLTRNYKYKDIDTFNYYPAKDSFGFPRMGIPIYDETKNLVGVSCRLMDTVHDYPKNISMSDGMEIPVPKYRMSKFNKGSILYNLHSAKDHCLKDGLIVVEGQLDVARLYTYGIKNAVCCMGTTLSMQQIALLCKHTFHTTFLVEEGEAAKKGILASIKRMNPHVMKISIAKLPSGDADSNRKDVILDTLSKSIELSKEEIEDIKNNRN